MEQTVIKIDAPKDVHTSRVKSEIHTAISKGLKTNEIFLSCGFVSNDIHEVISEFQIIKNRIAFNYRNQ